jgi:hypothetical protein
LALGVYNLGPVVFFVNQSAMAIRNETLAGHDLHPGWVRRRLVFEADRLVLRTYGEGIGPYPWANENLANQVWSDANADVFWRMLQRGGGQ